MSIIAVMEKRTNAPKMSDTGSWKGVASTINLLIYSNLTPAHIPFPPKPNMYST
ncbi:hypothetical protein HC752_18315 [Vibrio sp. S9_S30]|uniref:hypothetical protein n=1 Tax=Vibrio sp. S9_S30 TaxID=2720226 RepID=UPI0016819DDA|nr:hypothetical protein [Vibrio sp. S9_S30]MBD1558892.1 hypothetical protein [Vibrio sp. S9_S30]